MENSSLPLLLFVLISAAHCLGYIFTRLRQPRVIGEILAGVMLGPAVLGRIAPGAATAIFHGSAAGADNKSVLEFIYWLGLLLLMFVSGAETRGVFHREDRREVFWLGTVGTALPFLLVIAAGAWLPLHAFAGAAGQRTAVLLVVGIAVAVTSIPVISRIFYDLKILHTRFARLVLGVAVIEDTVLWAVLAIATALAASSAVPQRRIAAHVVAALLYFAAGLTVAPRLVRRLRRARWNFLAVASPVGYNVAVLLAYSAVAVLFQVSLVFAAFLAGYAVACDPETSRDALESISKFGFAVFIPVYFALVGYKLNLDKALSLRMLGGFVLAACLVKLASVSLGARIAGFRGMDNFNIAVATNARGGPGIVLASVAFDAGIINPAFFTTLVLLAILTSQAAGAWLEYVLRKGWPLLSAQAQESWQPATTAETPDVAA